MVWLKSSLSVRSSLLDRSVKVLLVIAHPDDEVMFFTPALLTLIETGHHVSILCMSSGNFEGMGSVRINELIKSAAVFQITAKDVHIIDDTRLQDGMTNDWPTSVIADIVLNYIKATQATMVRRVNDFESFVIPYIDSANVTSPPGDDVR